MRTPAPRATTRRRRAMQLLRRRGVQVPAAEAPPLWTAAVEGLAQQQAQTAELLSKLIASLAAHSAAPPLSPPVAAGSLPG